MIVDMIVQQLFFMFVKYTMKLTSNMSAFLGIMGFYIILSYLIGPIAFYYMFGKTLKAAGNGFVAGSVCSIALWYAVGSKRV